MTPRHRWRAEQAMLFCMGLALFACAAPATSRPAIIRRGPVPAVPVEGFIRADDGVRLYYRQVGSGLQTVIVPASLFLYRDLSVLASGRRMIFYDMRGRGGRLRVRERVAGEFWAAHANSIRRLDSPTRHTVGDFREGRNACAHDSRYTRPKRALWCRSGMGLSPAERAPAYRARCGAHALDRSTGARVRRDRSIPER